MWQEIQSFFLCRQHNTGVSKLTTTTHARWCPLPAWPSTPRKVSIWGPNLKTGVSGGLGRAAVCPGQTAQAPGSCSPAQWGDGVCFRGPWGSRGWTTRRRRGSNDRNHHRSPSAPASPPLRRRLTLLRPGTAGPRSPSRARKWRARGPVTDRRPRSK